METPASSSPDPSRTDVGIGDRVRSDLIASAKAIGFDAIGIASADDGGRGRSDLAGFLEAGFHGDMHWMESTKDRRAAVASLWENARTVISLGVSYAPSDDPLAILARKDRGAISCHARNRDYHDVLKKRLKALARWLVERTGAEVKVFVDTAPVMEKPAAERAGVGWQGKHTNLVSRNFGSWLLLGEILVDREIAPDKPHDDRCGSCRRCLDICPTNAFPRPHQLDARRCVSYLTIEHRGPIPVEFRAAIGNRIYGCDDCLAVCPWNKFARRSRESAFMARAELTAPRLLDFLRLDDGSFRSLFSGSPIKRIGRDRFIRNVLIALGNGSDPNAAPSIEPMSRDASPLVRGAAAWALSRLVPPPEFRRLRELAMASETDPDVSREWRHEAGLHGD